MCLLPTVLPTYMGAAPIFFKFKPQFSLEGAVESRSLYFLYFLMKMSPMGALG